MGFLASVTIYFQLSVLMLYHTNALHGNCSIDAAVTYTRSNIMYLFKDDKYAPWDDKADKLGNVASKSFSSDYCIKLERYGFSLVSPF